MYFKTGYKFLIRTGNCEEDAVVKLTYFRTTVYKQALASYKGQPEKFHTPLTSTHTLRKVHESKIKTHIL